MQKSPGKTETLVGYGILFVLAVIAGGIFLKQFSYHPAILRAAAVQPERTARGSPEAKPSMNLAAFAPPGLVALEKPECFGPENLSDKINGKAELYLSAGFERLCSQRFARKGKPEKWMESFVYDMGSSRGAFAVYSMQRRPQGKKLDLAAFAYKTENALFFAHGRYYVELVAATDQEGFVRQLCSFGRNFAQTIEAGEEALKELALFPGRYLVPESLGLIRANAFGFQGFEDVFIARYDLDGEELTAFLSRRSSAREAAALARSYCRYLLENGGREVETEQLPDARLVEIFGTFEVFFTRDNILAGVHGGESRQATESLAVMLQEELAGVGS